MSTCSRCQVGTAPFYAMDGLCQACRNAPPAEKRYYAPVEVQQDADSDEEQAIRKVIRTELLAAEIREAAERDASRARLERQIALDVMREKRA